MVCSIFTVILLYLEDEEKWTSRLVGHFAYHIYVIQLNLLIYLNIENIKVTPFDF